MQVHPVTSVSDVTHYLTSWNPNLDENIWKNLIHLITDARETNPYIPEKSDSKNSKLIDYSLMWEEQTGVNFPVMYVASVYLYLYAQSKGCDTFLFATRDCCHWVRIFKKLFPHTNAYYFHCSRNMLTRATDEHNEHYNKYVKSLIKSSVDKVIYIDIHGTCQRILEYFNSEFGHFPYCFLLSSSYRAYSQFPKVCQKAHQEGKLLNIVFDARGTPIEMLNFDVIGTIQNFDKNGPIRDPPEYSTKRLEPYHICIKYLVNQMKPWENVVPKSLRKKTTDLEFEELDSLIKRIYRVIQDNRPILINYIKHPGKH
jgi:hypothetical protein